MKPDYELNMAQVQADLLAASDAINHAESMSAKKAKFIKGVAGYHLQQATESVKSSLGLKSSF